MPETDGIQTIFDGHGGKTEQEFYMCVHCQGKWVPQPGSGRRRGFCLKCNGITCHRPECLQAGCNGSAERVFYETVSRIR